LFGKLNFRVEKSWLQISCGREAESGICPQ